MSKKQLSGLGLGMLGFIIPLVVPFPDLGIPGQWALSIFLLAAFFWMFEPVPIYATSMLVIFLEVVLLSQEGLLAGLLHTAGYQGLGYADYLATLASPIIILFLGGFMLAGASVKYNLDRNLTRILLKPFGQKPSMIMLGLMAVTALLSAFMSNTATTAMMVTVIIPIMQKTKPSDPFKIALALSIPFAANIGGIATPIGTPPNAVVIANLSQQNINIAFGNWMVLMIPLVLVMLAVTWVLLYTMFKPETQKIELELKGTFKTGKSASILYFVFALTVLLWVTESYHGINSSIVAMLPIVGLIITPVLEKEDIRSLPWEVLWLVAGGIALGLAMKHTGLAEWMVAGIRWESMPQWLLLIVFGAVAVVMSNFLSNTVTATLLIPLAISLGMSGILAGGQDMIITSLVIGVSASLAMVLPISTPPNAIAVSTGLLETRDMARPGIWIGIIGIMLVLASAILYWPFFKLS